MISLDLILKLKMKGYRRLCGGGEYSWHSELCLIIFILFELHYHPLGLFALFLKICMVLDRFQIGLYLLWHESF